MVPIIPENRRRAAGGAFLFFLCAAGAAYYYFAFFSAGRGVTHEVLLNEEGFSPRVLVVSVGDSVRFRTSRAAPFWPASDLHPSHALYPAFDPKRPLDPGETWEFQFLKLGTWQYHDHRAPSARGTIEVRERTSSSPHAEVSCDGDPSTQPSCWERLVESKFLRDGLDAAFELVSSLYAREPAFAAECHSYAHALGRAAYARYSSGEDVSLTPKTYYCGYGFYHGFMENLLADTGDPERARGFCAYADRNLSELTSDAEGACYHGIGHGAVDGSDARAWGDPRAILAPGIELCERIANSPSLLYRCVTGAYNALEILSSDPKYRLSDLAHDPFSFCETEPPAYHEACVTNMTPAVSRLVGDDLQAGFARIEAFREDPRGYADMFVYFDDPAVRSAGYLVRAMATMGLAHEFVRENLSRTAYAEDAIALCRSLNPLLRIACFEGIAGGHMKYGEPNEEYIQGLSFCAHSGLASDERDACYRHILTRLRIWYPLEKARSICGTVPEPYRARYCSLFNS